MSRSLCEQGPAERITTRLGLVQKLPHTCKILAETNGSCVLHGNRKHHRRARWAGVRRPTNSSRMHYRTAGPWCNTTPTPAILLIQTKVSCVLNGNRHHHRSQGHDERESTRPKCSAKCITARLGLSEQLPHTCYTLTQWTNIVRRCTA